MQDFVNIAEGTFAGQLVAGGISLIIHAIIVRRDWGEMKITIGIWNINILSRRSK